jgi:integrase
MSRLNRENSGVRSPAATATRSSPHHGTGRSFVLERAKPHSRGRAKTIATSTRAFLRFLVATGQCPAGRDHAVPRFASWQLASVPRFLAADDIERAIAACQGESRLRDRAIVLLLTRLGLRASEVANLKLTDIDWKNGRLAIAGKSRREEWLPLTQEVGDAIIAYIEQARPRLPTPRLFFTDFAPIRPVCTENPKSDHSGDEVRPRWSVN